MQESKGWPKRIKRGGATVTIYKIDNRGKPAYQVAHWIAGKRALKNFSNAVEATAYANKNADLLNAGKLSVARMHDSDSEAFVAAARILKPLDIPLLDAVRSYAAAMTALDGKGSLLDAAKEFAQRHSTATQAKPIGDVVTEFFEAKKQDGASPVYLRTMKYHLTPLTERFKTSIGNITAADLDSWLRSLGHSARTRRNASVTLTTLFRFARGRGYLPKNVPTEAENITRPKTVKGGKIEILTTQELRTILHAADTDARQIYFALGAFTGIRAAELQRIEWKHIDLERGHVEITAENAKTATRRLVPICPALSAWLAPFSEKKGKVFSSTREAERLVEWAGKQLGRWPKNALRHSFVSCRVAQSQDVAKTALEAGNTPQIIFSNYRELVTQADAQDWFSILPANRPANIITMKGKAA